MVEVTKIGNKTLVMDGKILSLFRKGSLLRQMYYGGYEDFDGANGGVWKKYINIPIKTVPLEYAQYLIEIDNTNVSVYNAKGDLKAQSAIASEFWSLVRSDGFDIRVFDHLFNQLWFWVGEFDYANKKAKIWVKLPENSEELNIAFGNEKASESVYNNGDNVFEFFDDFDGTELDTNKWWIQKTGGGVEVSDSLLKLYGTDTDWCLVNQKDIQYDPMAENHVFEFKIRATESNYFNIGLDDRNKTGDYIGSGFDRAIISYDDGRKFKTSREGNTTSYTRNTDVSGDFKLLTIIPLSDKVIFKLDGEEVTATSNIPQDPMGIRFEVKYSGNVVEVDYVFVTKLADPANFVAPRILEF